MSLLKTSLLNGIAVSVRMGTGLVLNKIFAIYLGPGGFAAIGQLQNFIAMVTTFAAGALNVGVTKYAAEYHDAPDLKKRLFRTAGTLTLLGSIVGGIFLVIFSGSLSRWLFSGNDYTEALIWLAVCLVLISLNALFLAVLAGQKEVRRYVMANIASSFIGLLVSGVLAWYFGLRGAMIALSLTQALSLVTTMLVCLKLDWFKPAVFFGHIDYQMVKLLSRFVMMAFVSAAVVPVTQMLIRSYLTGSFDMEHAGYWDAMNKISTIYLALITTTLSLYYLPRISEIKEDHVLRDEVWNTFKVVLPAVSMFALIIYLLRGFLTTILFSPDFSKVNELMGWQLIGDVIKVTSWLLGYVLLGKAMMKIFIVTEIVFSASLYLLTVFAANQFGFKGVAMAYALNYFLYFVTMYIVVMEWKLKRKNHDSP